MRHLFLIIFMTLFVHVSHAETRTFYLKSGDRVTGEIQSYDEVTKTYVIKPVLGVIRVKKQDMKDAEVRIYLKAGDKITGTLLKEDDSHFYVKTVFGELTIDKLTVLRVDMDLEDDEMARPGEITSRAWYFGEERLIDIFFDPTGYVLEKNVLYLSGLSWGYGYSDKLQFTPRYWDAAFGGIFNIRSK